MLVVWEDAGHERTQSNSSFIDDSGNGSEGSFEEEARWSIDSMTRPRRPIVEKSERVIHREIPVIASYPSPEALDVGFVDTRTKKFRKKSKASAVWSDFGED